MCISLEVGRMRTRLQGVWGVEEEGIEHHDIFFLLNDHLLKFRAGEHSGIWRIWNK